MNRVAIVLDQNGEFAGVASDEPIEFMIVAPHCPRDRVYLYESIDIGPEHVRALIGGFAVGHWADGTLGDGDGRGKLPPSKPILRVVD